MNCGVLLSFLCGRQITWSRSKQRGGTQAELIHAIVWLATTHARIVIVGGPPTSAAFMQPPAKDLAAYPEVWVFEAVLSEQPFDVARGTVPVTTAAAICHRRCRNELVLGRAKAGMIHYEMRMFFGSQGLFSCLSARGPPLSWIAWTPSCFYTRCFFYVGYICEFDRVSALFRALTGCALYFERIGSRSLPLAIFGNHVSVGRRPLWIRAQRPGNVFGSRARLSHAVCHMNHSDPSKWALIEIVALVADRSCANNTTWVNPRG